MLLARYVPPGGRVLDPFAGSGTTLVQSLESGYDATGVDVAAFNCLLMRRQDGALQRVRPRDGAPRRARPARATARSQTPGHGYIGRWFAPQAAAELLAFRSLIERLRARRRPPRRARPRCAVGAADDPLRPRLPARAAASSRTGATSTGASAVRSSAPSTSSAATRSTRSRGSRRSRACAPGSARRRSSTATRASSSCGGPFDAVITSPPYPGLIDYHEQHRYAYELLGLDDRRELEVGAAAAGTSKAAIAAYSDGIVEVLTNVRRRAATGRARSRSSSTTAASSTRRSSSGPGCGSRSAAPAREPAHGPAGRRVLRRRPRRARLSRSRFAQTRDASRFAWKRARADASPTRSSASTRGGSRSRRTSSWRCPGFTIVGLADRACQEAKHRVRSGIDVGRARVAGPRRITVNLAPAALRKEGSGFDLPIALAILARVAPGAVGALWRRTPRSASSRSTGACGRSAACSPSPRRRAGRASSGCSARPSRRAEAALAGIEPVPVRHLAEAAAYLRGECEPPPYEPPRERAASRASPRPRRRPRPGARAPGARARRRRRPQPAARRPAGHRQDDARPPPAGHAAAARARRGARGDAHPLRRRAARAGAAARSADPPFRAPHHSASMAAIVGGGRAARPGEVSLAHRGVLLLDELPEFMRPALEALRQPLEDGVVGVARAEGRAVYPARFQLVATMNLCPCGARGDPAPECSCSPQRLASFRDKLSRALLDRFDLVVTVPRPRARRARRRAVRGVGARWRSGRRRARAARRRAPRRTPEADELLVARGRAAAALGPRPCAGRACRADGRCASPAPRPCCPSTSPRRSATARRAELERHERARARRLRRRDAARHVVAEPQDARFARFRREFDERALS